MSNTVEGKGQVFEGFYAVSWAVNHLVWRIHGYIYISFPCIWAYCITITTTSLVTWLYSPLPPNCHHYSSTLMIILFVSLMHPLYHQKAVIICIPKILVSCVSKLFILIDKSIYFFFDSLILNELETEHQIRSHLSVSTTTLNSTATSLASEYPPSEATSYCSSFRDDDSLAHFNMGDQNSNQQLDQVWCTQHFYSQVYSSMFINPKEPRWSDTIGLQTPSTRNSYRYPKNPTQDHNP